MLQAGEDTRLLAIRALLIGQIVAETTWVKNDRAEILVIFGLAGQIMSMTGKGRGIMRAAVAGAAVGLTMRTINRLRKLYTELVEI